VNFEEAYQALLKDPKVDPRVKQLLEREYGAEDELCRLFRSHSWDVVRAARRIAHQTGAEVGFVVEAAWLHDIGIRYTHAPGIHCHGSEPYLCHGIIGRKICEDVGLPKHGLVCERHVGTGFTAREIEESGLPLPSRDMLNETLEQRVVCYADQFFSKSSDRVWTVGELEKKIGKHGSSQLERFHRMVEEFGPPELANRRS